MLREHLPWLWAAVALGALAGGLLTGKRGRLWAVFGALAGLVMELAGGKAWMQALWFFVVFPLLLFVLFLVRRLWRRHHNKFTK